MLFQKYIGAVCCAVALMCGGKVEGMEEYKENVKHFTIQIKNGTDFTIYYLPFGYTDKFCEEYSDCKGFNIWKKDAERFMTEFFIDKYLENSSPVILNDNRPEFPLWVHLSKNLPIWENWSLNDKLLSKKVIDKLLFFFSETEKNIQLRERCLMRDLNIIRDMIVNDCAGI